MKEVNVDKMVASKEITMSTNQKFWHFSIVVFFLIPPVYTIWLLIEFYFLGTYEGIRTPKEMMKSWFFVIPSIIFYFVQKRKLKMKEFEVPASSLCFEKALRKTTEELDWVIDYNDGHLIRAHRNWEMSTSWGELITIIKDGDRILINSICDPNAIFIAVFSFGWNKKNVHTFLKNLKKENNSI